MEASGNRDSLSWEVQLYWAVQYGDAGLLGRANTIRREAEFSPLMDTIFDVVHSQLTCDTDRQPGH
jgi:hypothetical protein